MKMLIAAALLLVASNSAMADTTVLKCKVPNSTAVTLDITLTDDQSVDFLIVNLTQKSGPTVFYSQMEKGSVNDQIKNGFLNLLALTETTSQVDGVITNSGFLGLGAEANGTFGGFLAALGNVYPLACTK